MNKKVVIVVCIVFVAILTASLIVQVDNLKSTNEKLVRNQRILLSQKGVIDTEDQSYKVLDSLSAAKASQLQLTLKEYEKYNLKNSQIIKELKIKQSNLENIITAQTSTINNLLAELQDSIQVSPYTNSIDTLKCFTYSSDWCKVSGCINLFNDSINLQIANKETLTIVETVIHKRFLGFLWKTSKIKDRQIDVLSDNPNTSIVGLDYIRIVP